MLTAHADSSLRLRLRDGDGLRWFDVNVAAGGTATLRLPKSVAEGMVIEREEGARWSAFSMPQGLQRIDFSSLAAGAAPSTARGASDALNGLFSLPFDANTVAVWAQGERDSAETAALGVSLEVSDRVGFLLNTAARRDQQTRYGLIAYGGAGAVASAAALIALPFAFKASAREPSLYLYPAVFGVTFTSIALISLAPSTWERARDEYISAVNRGERGAAVAQLDRFLEDRRSTYQTVRIVTRVFGAILAGAGLTAITADAVLGSTSSNNDSARALLIGTGATITGMGVGLFAMSFFQRSQDEDLYDALRFERQPTTSPTVQLGVMPTNGGLGFSLSGQF